MLNSLLNCRGLLVLVVNLKADELGLFGEGVKSALVIMAIVSTAMTGPLVHALHRPDKSKTDEDEATTTTAAADPQEEDDGMPDEQHAAEYANSAQDGSAVVRERV